MRLEDFFMYITLITKKKFKSVMVVYLNVKQSEFLKF